jgi:proteic killer suppression protein
LIQSFRHKGLERFFTAGRTAGIQARHAKRLRLQLAALDTALTIDDMQIPGYRVHMLKGKARTRWAIRVSGNSRLTFKFSSGHVYALDYEDDH